MKRVTLVFLALYISQCIIAQNYTWNYPIRPGTEKWIDLKNFNERLNALNIPDSILIKMSTSDLVETCLNYPELKLILMRNSFQSGYDYLKSIFNGFTELEKRSDSGKELIKLYEMTEPRKVTQFNTPTERGKFIFQLIYIELIMSQPEILKNLLNEDIHKFFEIYIKNFEEKISLPDEYSHYGISASILALGRLLDQVNYQHFEQIKESNIQVQNFIEKSHFTDIDDYYQIYNCSKDYLRTLNDE